jgi:hypothetical protein
MIGRELVQSSVCGSQDEVVSTGPDRRARSIGFALELLPARPLDLRCRQLCTWGLTLKHFEKEFKGKF